MESPRSGRIAFVGAGPAALVATIALARRGIGSTLYERSLHPDAAPRFNPERSYTVDISGHGIKALRQIDAGASFDARLLAFRGLKVGRSVETSDVPGWTGSRGDIVRALTALAEERHGALVQVAFEHQVSAIDVLAGSLTVAPPSGPAETRQYDLVVGADGAGSVVRAALERQIPGFTVEKTSLPNYCTMLALDRVGDRLDPHYLHGLSVRPFCVAGAIKGEDGAGPRWFCAVGTREKAEYDSSEAARRYLAARVPRVLELTSDAEVAAFARRTCRHIGQKLTCSQLHGGKAALIGDAAAPFPPIGQGVNAAMESAIVLAGCVAEVGCRPADLGDAARRYSARWKPEADAVSWISERSLFENRVHMLRARVAALLGLSIFEQAKRVDVPYSEVRRRAERLWPLWA